jgi:cell wall-associated NlpC family hydrolase
VVIALRRFVIAVATAAALLSGAVAPSSAQPAGGVWDPLLPMRPSAGAPGDPLAIANASLAVTAQATQATMGMGRKFLQSLGLVPPDAPNVAPGSVRGPAAVEYVIKRGGARLGTPYSWGGGKPTGPSLGVERGANTVGFDCSGFTQYSFAGVGVLIPKYSGDQFDTGRRVPVQQAKRGDLLFWGPGGSQHVAIYLGGGKMLESGGTADKVVVSPVRMAGLQPTVQRIIES